MVPRINAPVIGTFFFVGDFMNSKDKKILNDLKDNNCISLRKFLMFYYGICDSNILSHNLTHKDIKVLFPDLKRVSFDYVLDNIKEIYIGSIIMVKDSIGNCVPYINPKLDICIEDDINIEIVEENKDDIFEEIIDLENLSLYELVELAKKYKIDNRINEYRRVCRLIRKRKDNDIKIYHEKKEKIIMKGRCENDKY